MLRAAPHLSKRLVSQRFASSSSPALPDLSSLDKWDGAVGDVPQFQLKIRDRVALLSLDMGGPQTKVNTLHSKYSKGFVCKMNELQQNPDVDAIVLLSAKKDSFIVGADIGMLDSSTSQDLLDISKTTHAALNWLSKLPKPIVSAIHGQCLGGGLEMVLNTHYRIATTHPKTVLGLPEVKLGLLPGGTGTQKTVELLGLRNALELLLKGGDIRPEKARKMRLIDATCDQYALEDAAVLAAKALASKTLIPSRKLPFVDWALTRFFPLRNYVLKKAREGVMKATGGNYPAPLAILDAVKAGLEQGREMGLDQEARLFSSLGGTPESAALRGLFLGSRLVGHSRFGEPDNKPKKIAMLGAGLMGAGIAQVSAQKGRLEVVLYDVDDKALSRGMKQIYTSLSERVKRRIDSPVERDQVMSRIVPVRADHPRLADHLRDVDLIIEAVPEQLSIKHQVLSRMEEMVSPSCVIASNTSALPITQIASGLKRPDRVVGMHYFSPVDKMPLLEIITTEQTSRNATATAFFVGKAQGKTNIVVQDKAGFYTTRILAAFMPEVAPLIAEGIDPLRIDKALQKWGFPVGPITLVDEVGIDVGVHIGKDLTKHFGARMGPDSSLELLQAMAAKGMLGRKSGKGFFLYPTEAPRLSPAKKLLTMLGLAKPPSRKPVNPDAAAVIRQLQQGQKFQTRTDQEIQERMALRMVNEAVHCLEEGVLANPTEGDIGAVFGLGFPPFLGGPFAYIDRVGAAKVCADLQRLTDTYGPRFKPAEMLQAYAKDNKKFHTH